MCCHALWSVIFNLNQTKWKDLEMKTIFCSHEKVKFLQFGTSSQQSQRPVDQSAGAVDWTWKGAVWGLSWYWFVELTGKPVVGACPNGCGASEYFGGALGFDEYMMSDEWNGKKRLKENVRALRRKRYLDRCAMILLGGF